MKRQRDKKLSCVACVAPETHQITGKSSDTFLSLTSTAIRRLSSTELCNCCGCRNGIIIGDTVHACAPAIFHRLPTLNLQLLFITLISWRLVALIAASRMPYWHFMDKAVGAFKPSSSFLTRTHSFDLALNFKHSLSSLFGCKYAWHCAIKHVTLPGRTMAVAWAAVMAWQTPQKWNQKCDIVVE